MKNKIIYDGVEYKDRFVASTTWKPSFRMRLEFLFSTRVIMESESFLKDIMPEEKTICHVRISTIGDWFLALFKKKQEGMAHIADEPKDFWVECNVCKQRLKNWAGSTPCCGSIAFLVNPDNTVSDSVKLNAYDNGAISPVTINLKKDDAKN